MTNNVTRDIIGQAVVAAVAANIGDIASSAYDTARAEKSSLPSTVQVEAIAAKMVTQSPLLKSRRIWSAIFGALAAVLVVPDVQAMLGPWAPMLSAAIAAALAAWDKQADVRPFA